MRHRKEEPHTKMWGKKRHDENATRDSTKSQRDQTTTRPKHEPTSFPPPTPPPRMIVETLSG